MVTRPGNGLPSTYANGGTISFAAPTRDAVRAFHAAASQMVPSARANLARGSSLPTSYAAYARDPDGNKICTYRFAPA